MTRPLARGIAAILVLGGGWLVFQWMVETKQIFLIVLLIGVLLVIAYRTQPTDPPPAQVFPDPPAPEGFFPHPGVTALEVVTRRPPTVIRPG